MKKKHLKRGVTMTNDPEATQPQPRSEENRKDTHDEQRSAQYLTHTAKLEEVVEWRFYVMEALRGTSTGIGGLKWPDGHLQESDRALLIPPDTHPAHGVRDL